MPINTNKPQGSMSLFETGFKRLDTSAPVASTSASNTGNAGRNSKNRKRRRDSNGAEADSSHNEKTHSYTDDKTNGGPSNGAAAGRKEVQTANAEVNLEKLMKKLHDMEAENAGKNKGKASSNKTSQAAAFMKDKRKDERARAEAVSRPPSKKQKPTSEAEAVKTGPGDPAISSTGQSTAKKVKKWKAKKEKVAEAGKPDFVYDEAALAKQEERKRKKAAKETSTGGVETSSPKQNVEELSVAAEGKEHEDSQPEEDKEAEVLPPNSALTDLQKRMQQKLGGARFRWINEQLVGYSRSVESSIVYS